MAPKMIKRKPELIPPIQRNKFRFLKDKEEINAGDYIPSLPNILKKTDEYN